MLAYKFRPFLLIHDDCLLDGRTYFKAVVAFLSVVSLKRQTKEVVVHYTYAM
jgi:hypothetical protein